MAFKSYKEIEPFDDLDTWLKKEQERLEWISGNYAFKQHAAAVIFITVLVLLLMATSCASHRQAVTTCNNLDTARVEVREREVWRTDTVRVPLPAESRERATRDTASLLRTSLAESRAVWSGGTLTHTLRNIAQPVRVPVHARTIYIDSVATRTQVVEVEKPVERKLTPWQRTRINTWPYLAAAVLLAAAWAGRKPIARIARSLLN